MSMEHDPERDRPVSTAGLSGPTLDPDESEALPAACREIETVLIDFHFASATSAQRAHIRGHLLTCQTCLSRYLTLKEDIDAGAEEKLVPSEQQRRRLRADVAQLFRPTLSVRARQWLGQPVQRGYAMTGAAVFATVLVLLLAGLGPSSRGGTGDLGATHLAKVQPLVPQTSEGDSIPGAEPDEAMAVVAPQGPRLRHQRPRNCLYPEPQSAMLAQPRMAVDSARPEAASLTFY